MTCRFVPVRRIAALSVVITLFAAPLASAQSPEAAQPSAAPANTALLSPAAFARLVQPPAAAVAPAPVITDSPRPSLLRHGTAAVARQAQSAPTQAPQQKSWTARHKVLNGILIGVVVTFVAIIVCLYVCPE